MSIQGLEPKWDKLSFVSGISYLSSVTDQCTCTHGSVDVLLHLSLTYDLTPKTFMRFFLWFIISTTNLEGLGGFKDDY